MKNDKDEVALENIYEAFAGYVLRDTKPIVKDIKISGKVKITRSSSGWQAEIFDDAIQQYVPANDFLRDTVLKQHQKEYDDKENARIMQQRMAGGGRSGVVSSLHGF